MDKINQKKISPVIDISVRKLCKRPYPNHPKGCPNYGKKNGCPPGANLWTDIYDTNIATWVFWARFDLAAHREKMTVKHPTWSRRQLDCCLYWQSKARKPLYDYLKTWDFPGFLISKVPEAMGINVTETMRKIGIELEWPPEKWVYQVAMGGWLL